MAILAGMSSAAGAQDVQSQVLVSTGASVETNPYNTAVTDGPAIAATAEIRPLLRWRSERTTVDMRGLAQFRQFLSDYGLEDNYGADGNVSTRVSERLTIYSNLGFSYTEGGFNNFARPGLLPGVPAPTPIPGVDPTLPDPAIIDVTVLGQRVRTKAFDMGLGANTQLGAYSNLSVNVTGRASRFADAGFGDFNTISGQTSYTHQLNETLSIGLSGSVARTDYLGTRVGDALVTSVSGTVDYRLGARWTLWGSAGLAMSRIDQLVGTPDDKFNSLTMQIRFCNQGERGRFCLSGNRSPEPSANGNVRVNTTLQSDYSLRVSERETFTLSGSYARTGRGRGVVAFQPGLDFISAALRYDNQLRNNLTFYASTNFSKIYTSVAPRNPNFGVNAGLQFHFGALQ